MAAMEPSWEQNGLPLMVNIIWIASDGLDCLNVDCLTSGLLGLSFQLPMT